MRIKLGWQRWSRAALWLGACACLSACGQEGPPDEGSPPDQCRKFVGAYCAKLVECALPSDRSRAKEDCAFNFEVNLPCDNVVDIAGSMPDCVRDLGAISCGTVVPPGSWPTVPPTCKILVIQ